MAEYISREAAIKDFERCNLVNPKWTPERVKQLLCRQPEEYVDAVEVVRCRECKHSTLPSGLTQRYGKLGTLTCHNMHAPSNRRNVGSNDFCSYGEQKEGAD